MDKRVIIVGAGGQGKVVADIVKRSGDTVIGFLDDGPCKGYFAGAPVLGKTDIFNKYSQDYFVIAIGDAYNRRRAAEKLAGVRWYTAVHPRAVISDIEVSIGEGSMIMANAVLNPGTTIGKHCIINSSAVVEHDNHIEDFVHVSVGAKLAGAVHVGENTWIGIGASVSNNLTICADCIVGAGCVVVKNIETAGTYVGVPAERLDMKERKSCLGGGKNWITFRLYCPSKIESASRIAIKSYEGDAA